MHWEFLQEYVGFVRIFFPLFSKAKIFTDSFPISFLFQTFQPKSFHGSLLAIASAAYLLFTQGVDRVYLIPSFRVSNNFALCSSIKCQNMSSSYPICNLVWVPVPFSHSQLTLSMLTSFLFHVSQSIFQSG